MVMPHFEVNVNKEGTHPVLYLRGEVDFATAPVLQDALNETISEGADKITLDFQEVTFLDSEGLKVLLDVYRQLNKTGGTIALHGCSKYIAKIFEILGIRGIFGVEESKNHIL